jgi:hypothetical protein
MALVVRLRGKYCCYGLSAIRYGRVSRALSRR